MDQTEIIGLIITMIQIYIPCLGVSIAYFIAGKNRSMIERIVKSSHGLLFVVAYTYAMIAQNYTAMGDTGYWLPPFHVLMVVGFVSILLSAAKYVKPAWYFLYLIEVPIALMIWIAGYLSIIHDSM